MTNDHKFANSANSEEGTHMEFHGRVTFLAVWGILNRLQ